MPELPEVESIKKSLKPKILGKKLIRYEFLDKRTSRFNNDFPSNLGTLDEISRKGKVLIFKFRKYSLLFHLGMSGRIEFSNSVSKHTRAYFKFTKIQLNFDDIRKFGFVKLISNDCLDNELNKLGPDALNMDKKLYLLVSQRGQNSKVAIKKFLLNQKNISGIGNIYVNEILFISKINPKKLTNKLSKDEWDSIYENTKKVLKKAIKNNGTTLGDLTYYLPDGNFGQNLNSLLIYGQLNCKLCNRKIVRMYLDQRATYFCKKCQKL